MLFNFHIKHSNKEYFASGTFYKKENGEVDNIEILVCEDSRTGEIAYLGEDLRSAIEKEVLNREGIHA